MEGQSKTAYVTGGSSGIGLAIASALVARKWKVGVCGRDGAKLTKASAALSAVREGAEIHARPADVSREDDVRRWIAGARESLGPPHLLVNSAGVGQTGEIAGLKAEDWSRALDINLKGAFLVTREVVPMMRAEGGGYIVNIASLAGKKGMAGGAAYCASKFGLVGFTETLIAEEKGNGIRATSICPGYVATPMVAGAKVPPAEMIQPEDLAATVLYLLELSPEVIIREIVIERRGA